MLSSTKHISQLPANIIESSPLSSLVFSQIRLLPITGFTTPLDSYSIPTVPQFDEQQLLQINEYLEPLNTDEQRHLLAYSLDLKQAILPVDHTFGSGYRPILPNVIDRSALDISLSHNGKSPELCAIPLDETNPVVPIMEVILQNRTVSLRHLNQHGPARPPTPASLDELRDTLIPDYATVPQPPAYVPSRQAQLLIRQNELRSYIADQPNASLESIGYDHQPATVSLPSQLLVTQANHLPVSQITHFLLENLSLLYLFRHDSNLSYVQSRFSSMDQNETFTNGIRNHFLISLNDTDFYHTTAIPQHHYACHDPKRTTVPFAHLLCYVCTYPLCCFNFLPILLRLSHNQRRREIISLYIRTLNDIKTHCSPTSLHEAFESLPIPATRLLLSPACLYNSEILRISSELFSSACVDILPPLES